MIEVFRNPPIEIHQQDSLTPRENEILHLLAKGYSNKEIASQLQCTAGTIRIHLQHIYEKLHVRCRVEAVLKWLDGVEGVGSRRSRSSAGKLN